MPRVGDVGATVVAVDIAAGDAVPEPATDVVCIGSDDPVCAGTHEPSATATHCFTHEHGAISYRWSKPAHRPMRNS